MINFSAGPGHNAMNAGDQFSDVSQFDRDHDDIALLEYLQRLEAAIKEGRKSASTSLLVSEISNCLIALEAGTSYDTYVLSKGWTNLGKPPKMGGLS